MGAWYHPARRLRSPTTKPSQKNKRRALRLKMKLAAFRSSEGAEASMHLASNRLHPNTQDRSDVTLAAWVMFQTRGSIDTSNSRLRVGQAIAIMPQSGVP